MQKRGDWEGVKPWKNRAPLANTFGDSALFGLIVSAAWRSAFQVVYGRSAFRGEHGGQKARESFRF